MITNVQPPAAVAILISSVDLAKAYPPIGWDRVQEPRL